MISVGFVPSEWLNAIIIPVFKKEVSGKPSRPISLTCVLSKIVERILSRRIFAHLQFNDILHSSQHGFCRNRSTTTNLLESLNDLTLTILSKDQHTVVYVDFSKAFDVVSHPKLFTRLHNYGVRGAFLSWLTNFFTGRTHQTKIDFTLSDIALLYSGVIQGSGIGSLMFLVYINELIYVLEEHGITVNPSTGSLILLHQREAGVKLTPQILCCILLVLSGVLNANQLISLRTGASSITG